jgi:hypothetical protein
MGILLVLAAIPVAAFAWSLLPEGRYPVIAVAVPALPFLAVGGYMVRRSNIGLEKFVDEHPTAFTWTIVGVMVLALLAWGVISDL